MKKIIAIICAITMMCTTLTGCGVNRKDLYDVNNKDITLANVFFLAEEESATDTDVGAQKAEVDAMYEKLENVKFIEREKLQDLETKMTEYFCVNYGVDVSEKFANIETYIFDVKDPTHFLMGFHIPGENKVYVNREIYQETPEYMAFTWCHEVIHLLGIDYKDPTYWGLYEAVTEAVNINLMDWMDKPCNSQSAYFEAAEIGMQLVSANPELVSKSLADDEFFIEDSIDEVLKDANYTEAVLPENTSIAFQLNAYLICVIEMNQMYYEFGMFLYFFIQEITTAYCRSFNLSEEQIEYAKTHWIFGDFDKTTIKCGKDYIEFKR